MVPAAAETVRVVVIEDSRHMQSALGSLFEVMGGLEMVATLGSEMEAASWVQEHGGEWDIATVDLLLEEGSGFNVIPRLRDAAPRNTVIVLSDFVTPAVAARCRALGADAVFGKSETKAYAQFIESAAERIRQRLA